MLKSYVLLFCSNAQLFVSSLVVMIYLINCLLSQFFQKSVSSLALHAGVPRIFTDKENAEIAALELQFSHEDDHNFLEYIQNSRININIRQVF